MLMRSASPPKWKWMVSATRATSDTSPWMKVAGRDLPSTLRATYDEGITSGALGSSHPVVRKMAQTMGKQRERGTMEPSKRIVIARDPPPPSRGHRQLIAERAT